jgi:hypothetical protein
MPLYIVIGIPVSDARRDRQAEALSVQPFNKTAIHVPSREKVRVRVHHRQQDRLNLVDAASPSHLRALGPTYLISAEETAAVLVSLEEATFYVAPINLEHSSGNHLISHARSSTERA